MNCMSKKHILNENIIFGVVGSHGRMGTEILSILKEKNLKFITNENKETIFLESDVIIDFSSNEGLEQCLDILTKIHKPFISGSTPMNDKLYNKMITLSKNNKICWSANMSIGIAIMKKISFMLGEFLDENQYDCEILEKHHNKKLDSPSGTALLLGQEVANGRNVNFKDVAKFDNRKKIRKIGDIGFSSIRGGNIFGVHEVMFIGKNEEISLKHTAFNRKMFAIGAIKCALKLLEKNKNGFYYPEDLLFNNKLK